MLRRTRLTINFKEIHIMTAMITPPQMLRAMEAVCGSIEDQKEYLSELDGAIGDVFGQTLGQDQRQRGSASGDENCRGL